MSTHTPGPWFIWQELAMQNEGYEDSDEITDELLGNVDHSIYAGQPKECTRGRLRGHKAHICDIDADSYDFDDDEDVLRATALANARLIASAPDLLADLIVATETLRHYETLHRAKGTTDSDAKAEANAALAGRFEATIFRATGDKA